ncbi:uncharacterized protein LOC129912083 isoform X2 [Episyrphus balteatus]|uniref:uncharacterized protein LOC129912083 isoform X2 n=1 Tax=Episyrphus balteatus TaxID=286459 RepID=UPI002486A205|nr:uncharacterized protein LOC129912083 isoform X2 [Episyrphus balteatus]
MYGPPETDSEDDYDGFSFGDTIIEDHRRQNHFVFEQKSDHDIEQAIEEGELNKLTDIIEEGNININNPLGNGTIMLALACRAGQLEIVKYLLGQKANVNKQVESVTPLMETCACIKQCREVTEIAKLLLAAGAVVNVSDKYGTTPFMLACQNGHMDVVRLFINDVSFDAVDNQGCTPIFHAIENNRADIVKFLVESGANASVANKKGYTPRQVAQFHGFYDILEMLPKEKGQPYQVPTTFLSYNSICDMIPRIFLKSECPEYFQDINLILMNMGMENILEYFAKEKTSLADFLTMNEERLEEIGIEYPIHRLKVLKGLLNFHLNQWTKRSIARVQKGRPDNFYEILVLSANHLQNLVIINSSLKYVKYNSQCGHFGPISTDIVQSLRKNLQNYRAVMKDLNQTTSYLQSFSPAFPPLYIDYDDYLAEKKKNTTRKILKYTFFVAVSVVICLKMQKIF